MGKWPPPIPGRLSLHGEPPFVGRRVELETLEAAWESVQLGKRQVVFVGGEPGAGKTRLVAEVASALNQQGIGVLSGTSFVDYGFPYQPFVECIEHLLQADVSRELAALTPTSARHLMRLTPQIALHVGDLQGASVGRNDDRVGLFSAVQELLRELSAKRPLALILEDLHWALEPTRQLLSYLVQSAAECALLILVTYRTTAPDRSQSLTKLMADLYRLPGVHRIDLAGLNVTDIAQYVVAWRGIAIGEARSSAVVLRDQTGGNPFFIRELLTHDVESLEEALVLPTTVLDALGARLEALSTESLEVIELAAVIGDEFDLSTLLAVKGDSECVLRALDDASEAGLVIRQPGEPAGYRFRHSLTREAVRDRMSSSRRAEAHLAVALAVEKGWPDSATRHAVLAHHYQEASVLGFSSHAMEHALLAAEHAESTLAYEDAASWFRRAAVLGDSEQHDSWMLSAASNLVRAGDFASARAIYADITHTSNPNRMAEAAIGYEDASWRVGLHGTQVVQVLERALESIEEDPNDPLYITLLSRLGRALAYAGRRNSAELSTKAVSLAGEIGDPALIASTLGAGVNQIFLPDRLEVTAEQNDWFWDWARASGTYDEMAQAAGFRVNIAYMMGDRATHDAAAVALAEAVEAGDLAYWRFFREAHRYGILFIQGDLTEAEEVVDECLIVGQTFDQGFTDGPYGLQKFMIAREMGRLETVRPIVEAIDDPQRLWSPGVLALYAELGMIDRAAQFLELVCRRELDRPRTSWDWPAVLALVAEAVIAVGDRRYAEMWRPALAEYSGLNLLAGSFVAVFGAADRYLGQIDAILDLPSAEEHFAAALDLDVRMGSTLHEVESLISYAAYLGRSTDHRKLARAAEYRQRARAIAEGKKLVRQLRRLDESTSLRSDRPAGLTPREIGVLRLIAEGLSNKEIADRLYISENTAANHIRKILLKTQAPNRTKAAVFASEKGLLD